MMGAMYPPYELTPADEVRLLAEGITPEHLDDIRKELARDLQPYGCRIERTRTEIYIDKGGLTITKY